MLVEPFIAHARWWACACLKCVSGLRRLKKYFEFLEKHSCIWPGAQIWFRQKWRKLVTASFLLLCFDWFSCLRYWNEFFLSCVSGFRLKFSRIALWWKRLQLDPKSHLTTNGLILGFSVGKWLLSLTSYLCRLKSAIVAQLLFFFDEINSCEASSRSTYR